jgi:carbamoyl-phosphate synthase large subunit
MTELVRAAVAVTGMNANDNPGPGVAVARCLRHEPDFQGRIIGLGYDPLDAGFYAASLLDGGALLPYPSAGQAAFLQRLRELRAQFSFSALIPTLDSELRAVIALESELHAEGIGTFVPSLDAVERASKPQLPRLAASGIRIPESENASTVDAIPKLVQSFGLPVVVKGVYYGAYVAHTEADAIAAFHHYAATWGIPVVVQRFLAGDEYNVCALGDGTGNTIGAVAMRKLALTDKGKGWAGVTVANPELLTLAESVIAALKWRGPLEVEVLAERGSSGSVSLHVIEINPRFPAWVYLTAAAGQNLPYACARLALGLSAGAALAPCKAGTMFVRIALDQVADMATFGALSATGTLLKSPRTTA